MLSPILQGCVLEDAAADFKNSTKVEKYRISENAVYLPDGFHWRYLRLCDLTKISDFSKGIETKGCWHQGFLISVPAVRLEAGDHREELVFDRVKCRSEMLKKLGVDEEHSSPSLAPADGALFTR